MKIGEEMMPGDQDTPPTRQLVADAITDALEDLWLEGKIPREARDTVYFDVGYFGDFPDLLPWGTLTLREEELWREKGETSAAKLRIIVDRTKPKPNGEHRCLPSTLSSECPKESTET